MVSPQDEELLADLLIEWEELYERGQDTPARELCKEYPHLSEELSRRISTMKVTDWLNNPDPPADDPPAIAVQPLQGRVLTGRYRLDDLIAEGGFAQVWRAYDTELQRIVAIKVPKPGRLESSESFLAEARRVARLKHPGIVPVHDVGVEGDQCFIVSEFIEGGSLAENVARTKPPQDQVIGWLCEIADALEYAHLHGVIHRDIKPANILIDHHGRALLADFGIAQSAQKTGVFAPSLGTLRYMSPEQLEGKPSTPQSDIYSLGVVLYECLTGKLPYAATDPTGLRKEITAGRPPERDRKLPTNVTLVANTAMSRSPEKRHISAAHFAEALRRAGSNTPNRIRRLAALWLLVFGSMFGIGWYVWHASKVPAAAKAKNGDTAASEVSIPKKTPSPLPSGTKAVVLARFDKFLGRSFTPLLVEQGVRVATNVWSLDDVDLTGVRCVLITAASYDPEHRPTDREVAVLEGFVRDGGVCLLCGLTWHIKQSVPRHPLNLFSRELGIYFGGHVGQPTAVPGGPLDGISFDMPGPKYLPSAIMVSNPDAKVLACVNGTSGAASIVAVPYGKGWFIGIGHHVLLQNRPLLERLIAKYVPDLIPQTTSNPLPSKASTESTSVMEAIDIDHAAELEVLAGAGARLPLENGNKLFNNRGYVWKGIPEDLPAMEYHLLTGGGTEPEQIRVTKAGWVYVVTPLADFTDIAHAGGWDQIPIKIEYTDVHKTKMVFFRRRHEIGEYTFQRRWAGPFIVVPAKTAGHR